jgi:uncharacterized protein with GYD domain
MARCKSAPLSTKAEARDEAFRELVEMVATAGTPAGRGPPTASAGGDVGQGEPVRLSNVASRSYWRKTMTIYIALFNLTDAGIKAAKDSPRRLDAAKKLRADMGGEMKQFYMVMGEFDFVGICEAPDDAVMARYVLQLGSLGFVRTKTLKAFPESAYREIIRSLG